MSAPLGGGLIASVRAVLDISDFTKNAAQMSAQAAKVAKAVGRVGGAIAPLAAAFNAGLGAAVKHAAEFSHTASEAVHRAKVVFDNLAISVSNLVLPAFRALTEHISHFVAWLQSLNAHQRANIASFLEHTAVILAGVAAFGKFSSIAASMLRAFSVLAPVIAAVGLPLVGVVLAVGAVTLAFGYLYHKVKPYWDDLKLIIKETWDSLVIFLQPALDYVEKALGWLRDKFFETLESVARLVDTVGSKFGKDLGMIDMLKALKESLADGSTLNSVKNLGQTIGHSVVAGVKEGIQGLKEIYKDSGAEAMINKMTAAAKSSLGIGNKVGTMENKIPVSFEGIPDDYAKYITSLRKPSGAGGGAEGPVEDSESAYEKNKLEAFVAELERVMEPLRSRLDSENKGLNNEAKGKIGEIDTRPLIEVIAENLDKASKEALQAWVDAFKQKVVSSLGRLGEVIQSAQQGFQAGGPWAALVAVIADLISHSQEFTMLIHMVDTMFQEISDALGQFLKPLEPLIGAIQDLVANVLKRLGPFLNQLGMAAQNLAPIIEIVASLFQIIAPLLTILMGPMRLAGNLLKDIWPIMKYFVLAIGYIILGISYAYNAIIKAVQFVFNAIGFLDSHWKKMAKDLDVMFTDTGAIKDALNTLNNMTWDSAMAQANATAATLKFADSMGQATGVLNAPDGFKVSLEEWTNMRARNPNTVAAPGTPIIGGSGTSSNTPGSNPPVVINVNGVTDPGKVAQGVGKILGVGPSLPRTGFGHPYLQPAPRYR